MFGDETSTSKGPSVQVFSWPDARALVALGVAGYAAALAAGFPASLAGRLAGATDRLAAIGGTVWRGQAALAGGHRVDWRLDPVRSLTSLTLAADWRIEGPDTRLDGRAAAGLGGFAVTGVEGRADWSLIAAVAPGLPVTCAANMRVDIARAVAVGRGLRALEGEAVSDPGRCAPADGEAAGFDVPALRATAAPGEGGVAIRVTPVGDAGRLLARAEISADGRITAAVEPEGAQLFGGRPLTIEVGP